MQEFEGQRPEHQHVRQHIHDCFSTIRCCLMPHPGKTVATDRYFKGRMGVIDEEFKEQLAEIIPHLLAPQNLIVKENNGNKVTGTDLLAYFKVYMKVYQSEALPQLQTIFHATAQANHVCAVASSKDLYREEMEHIYGNGKPHVKPDHLEEHHKQCRAIAWNQFKSKHKMGSQGHES